MKQQLFRLYGFVRSFCHPHELFAAWKSIFDERVYDNDSHLQIAADWLLYMQNEDGGYSRKFSFITGRDKSYIETTGYIVPTLLQLPQEKYKNSALEAGEWLLKIQNRDGSFSEIDNNQPFVFDTGQVLLGLNALYLYTQDQRYKQALIKAAHWLVEVQEEDGSWQRFAYNRQKHTYYSRVAYALYEAGELSEIEIFKQNALKNVEWVISNQLPNGFFRYASFLETAPPFLHTIVYVLEGLLDIYNKTKEEKVLDAVLKNATKLKEAGVQRDFILCSQYDETFDCVNKERCITGLAQWAGVALRLYGLTNDESFLQSASTTLFYLKAKQIRSSSMQGGFSASIPFWGRYGGFDFVNWSNKFFIDALLLYNKIGLSKTKEQEYYVASSFGIGQKAVTDTISVMDAKYLTCVKRYLTDKEQTVLDVGCGKGVIINELAKEYEKSRFFGVDPVFESGNIQRGSVYSIDGEYDIVMSFEVLQHTYVDEALRSIYKALKPKGKIFIGERNPVSVLGLLKPFYELGGKWMYPFDSAFRERWYSKREWEIILKRNGFRIENICFLENEKGKIPKMNRYFFIVGEKV